MELVSNYMQPVCPFNRLSSAETHHLLISLVRKKIDGSYTGGGAVSADTICGNLVSSISSRRGSVVRTSVFGWRTFPDLRLTYG